MHFQNVINAVAILTTVDMAQPRAWGLARRVSSIGAFSTSQQEYCVLLPRTEKTSILLSKSMAHSSKSL
jgi:hypothetical protein